MPLKDENCFMKLTAVLMIGYPVIYKQKLSLTPCELHFVTKYSSRLIVNLWGKRFKLHN